MSETIVQNLEKYGAELIAMFGKIHPYAGAAITVIIGALIAYFSFRSKKEKVEKQNTHAGESIGQETPKDQETVGSVQDKLDDFLKK